MVHLEHPKEMKMSSPASNTQLKEAVKTALTELIAENPEIFKSVIEEALEDIGMGKAIHEGLISPAANESEVVQILSR